MKNCSFPEGEPPFFGLPRFATITQVSLFLEIPREAVRSAVRRAAHQSETWIKKVEGSDGLPIYLLDTQSAPYQAHEARWKQNKRVRDKLLRSSLKQWSEATASGQQTPSPPQLLPASPLAGWPRFRHWLFAMGVWVFRNVLAEADHPRPWQWYWEGLHGEGYRSDEEAVVAALQTRFDEMREDLLEQERLLMQRDEQEPPPTSVLRLWPFRLLWPPREGEAQ